MEICGDVNSRTKVSDVFSSIVLLKKLEIDCIFKIKNKNINFTSVNLLYIIDRERKNQIIVTARKLT